MIRYTKKHKIKGKWILKDLYVYEREEEVPDYINVVNPGIAQEDDYIHTNNGYYVPIIIRKEKHLDKMKKVYLYSVQNNYWFFDMYYTSNKMPLRYNIYFDRDKVKEVNYVSKRAYYFIELLNMNLDIFEACKIAYKAVYNDNVNYILGKLFNDKEFIKLFKRRIQVDTLKNKLENAGINEQYYFNTVKSILDDKKETPLLRKEALNIITSFVQASYEEQRRLQSNSTKYNNNKQLNNNINNKILQDNLDSI